MIFFQIGDFPFGKVFLKNISTLYLMPRQIVSVIIKETIKSWSERKKERKKERNEERKRKKRFLDAITRLYKSPILCPSVGLLVHAQLFLCTQFLFLEICILQLTKKVSPMALNLFPGNRNQFVYYRKYEKLLGQNVL